MLRPITRAASKTAAANRSGMYGVGAGIMPGDQTTPQAALGPASARRAGQLPNRGGSGAEGVYPPFPNS
jgi:hypothetical protein